MLTWTDVAGWITLVIVGLATLAWTLTKKGLETVVEKSAENAIAKINWTDQLSRALQQTRGEERQELRFTCYAALWAKLRDLALYDSRELDQNSAARLSSGLSDWYFSTTGGLLLTREARPFYFALQDLLKSISVIRGWRAEESTDDQRQILISVLQRLDLAGSIAVMDYLQNARFDDWEDKADGLGAAWKSDLGEIMRESTWNSLTSAERFAVMQQTGSVLRSALTADIESRIR